MSAPSSWERRRPRRPIGTDATPPSGKNKATSIHRRDWFVRENRRRPCKTVPARAPALPGGPRMTCLRGGHRHGLTHLGVTRWDATSLFGTRNEAQMIDSDCRHHHPVSAGALAGPSVQTPRHHLARTVRVAFSDVMVRPGKSVETLSNRAGEGAGVPRWAPRDLSSWWIPSRPHSFGCDK